MSRRSSSDGRDRLGAARDAGAAPARRGRPGRAGRRGNPRLGGGPGRLDPVEQERFLLTRAAAKTNRGVGTNANWGGEKERLKQLQTDFDEEVRQAKAILRANALLGLLPHVEGFVTAYAAERKRNGRADFDDLLFWARDLLRDSRDGTQLLPNRLPSGVDRRVPGHRSRPGGARYCCSPATRSPVRTGARSDRRPGRLTVVGDPKQSIYRFRRADIAVYDQVKTEPLAEAASGSPPNFRSQSGDAGGPEPRLRPDPRGRAGESNRERRAGAPPTPSRPRRPPIALALGSTDDDAEAECAAEEATVIAAMIRARRRARVGRSATATTGSGARPVARHRDPAPGTYRTRPVTSRHSRRPGSPSGRGRPRRSSRDRRCAT